MNEDRFDKALEHLRASYNRPPDTPREEMWQAIRTTLAADEDPKVLSLHDRRRRYGRREATVRWASWSIAAAALLVMGIGIGRMSSPGLETASGTDLADAGPTAPMDLPAGGGAAGVRTQNAFRFAAVSHLIRTEWLLTMVKNDSDAGRYDGALGAWAAELLTDTRLLMDSPASRDPAIQELLEDLELVLVQVARLSQDEGGVDRGREELDLIADGMDRQEMLLRIQAVVPAGSGLVGA